MLKVDERNLSDMLVNINNSDLKALVKYVRMMGQSKLEAQLEVPKTELGRDRFLEVADFVRTQGKMSALYSMITDRGTSSQSPNPANMNAVLTQLGSYEIEHSFLSTKLFKAGEALVDKAPKAEVYLELEDEAKLLGEESIEITFDYAREPVLLPPRTKVSCGTFKGLGDNDSCKKVVPGFVTFPMAESQIIQEASYSVQTKASSGNTTIVPAVVTQMADDLKPYIPEGMCDTVTQNVKQLAKSLKYEPQGTMVGPEFAAAFINHLATQDPEVVRDSLHDLSTIMINGDTTFMRQFWQEKKVGDRVVWKSTVNIQNVGGTLEKTRKESIPPYAIMRSLNDVPTLETTSVTLQSLLDARGGNDNAPGLWGGVSIDGLSITGPLRAAHDFLMLLGAVAIKSDTIYVMALTDNYLISLLKANYPNVTFVIIGKKVSSLNEVRVALERGGIIHTKTAHPRMFSTVHPESFVYLDLFAPMPRVAGKVFQTAADTMTSQFQTHFRSLKSMWSCLVTKQYIGFMPKTVTLSPCITTHLGEVIYSNRLNVLKNQLDYTTILSYCIYQAWFVTTYRWHRYNWNGSMGALDKSWKAPHPRDGTNIKSGIIYKPIKFVSYGLSRVRLVVPDISAAIAVGGSLDDFDMSLSDLLPIDDFAKLVENDLATRAARTDMLASIPARPKNNIRDIGAEYGVASAPPIEAGAASAPAEEPQEDEEEVDLPADEYAQV